MRIRSKLRTRACQLAVAAVVTVTMGCNMDSALFVDDWVRDLALGSIALVAAYGAVGQVGPQGEQGEQGEQGAPGAPGEIGQAEQGAPGAPGAQGSQGDPGAQGDQGETGEQGVEGEKGDTGDTGDTGDKGDPGPELFDVFVDEFYIQPVNSESTWVSVESNPAFWDSANGYNNQAIGFKTMVPARYDAATQNPVTMRIFLYFNLESRPERLIACEYFELAGVRLRDGAAIETYGDPVWIVLNQRANDDETFLVVDIPLNDPAGLALSDDLEPGQVLAFGLAWRDIECPEMGEDYRIIGVEFFETKTATLRGVTIEDIAAGQNCWCGHPPEE